MSMNIYELAGARHPMANAVQLDVAIPRSTKLAVVTLPNAEAPWFPRFPKDGCPYFFQVRGSASGQRLYIYAAPKGEEPWDKLPSYEPGHLMTALRTHHQKRWAPSFSHFTASYSIEPLSLNLKNSGAVRWFAELAIVPFDPSHPFAACMDHVKPYGPGFARNCGFLAMVGDGVVISVSLQTPYFTLPGYEGLTDLRGIEFPEDDEFDRVADGFMTQFHETLMGIEVCQIDSLHLRPQMLA